MYVSNEGISEDITTNTSHKIQGETIKMTKKATRQTKL
jgi:hypothetical protein